MCSIRTGLLNVQYQDWFTQCIVSGLVYSMYSIRTGLLNVQYQDWFTQCSVSGLVYSMYSIRTGLLYVLLSVTVGIALFPGLIKSSDF